MPRFRFPFLTRGALLSSAIGLSSCAAVDASYAPRTDQVTHEVGDQRDRNTLTNIVRASRYEPLNFTALAKYTANGTLQLTSNVLTRQFMAGAVLPGDMFGPNNAMGLVSNSFDLGSLENHDFYAGLLHAIDLTKIDFLLNSGFDRELVMQATIAAIDIETNEHKRFRVYNDPTNDQPDERTSSVCGDFTPGSFDAAMRDKSLNSCLYSKFRFMLLSALKKGVMTQATEIKPLKDAEKDRKFNVRLCFEPALAFSEKGDDKSRADPPCNDMRASKYDFLYFPGHPAIRSAAPIFRSTYGVFQYLGTIMRGEREGQRTREKAEITQDTKQVHKQIFPFQTGTGDCFVSAEGYCITNDTRNGNGRQLIALLNALVALNVSPQALPITPSVQLSPGSL